MDPNYFTWRVAGVPAISISPAVMEGIHQEILEAFAAVPKRGAETGGLLVGRATPDELVIEDFEPIPSEHRFGPSYHLSEADRQVLEESLQWYRGGGHPGLGVVGYYRSNTRPALAPDSQDEELLRSAFKDSESVFLLVQPSRTGPSMANIFIGRDGRMQSGEAPQPFPFGTAPAEVAQVAEVADVGSVVVATQADAGPVPVIDWPAPRSRLLSEPKPSSKSSWLWYTAAAVLGVVGGALGYLALHPEAGAVQRAAPKATVPSQPAPAPAKPSSMPATKGVEDSAERATADPAAAVQAILDRWSTAIKRGDADAAAQYYAPQVATYFDLHNADRDQVRRAIRQSLSRYGGLDIYRLSGIKITSVAADRAVVTFRKHWQTSGYRKSAGEEQERLVLVRNQGAWQISSEQEEKIYWTRRPR